MYTGGSQIGGFGRSASHAFARWEDGWFQSFKIGHVTARAIAPIGSSRIVSTRQAGVHHLMEATNDMASFDARL
jgi:hypothetical protein